MSSATRMMMWRAQGVRQHRDAVGPCPQDPQCDLEKTLVVTEREVLLQKRPTQTLCFLLVRAVLSG